MSRHSSPTADTRAAFAALARLPVPELNLDRILLIDDSDEDMTQIITVLTERTCPAHVTFQEVHS